MYLPNSTSLSFCCSCLKCMDSICICIYGFPECGLWTKVDLIWPESNLNPNPSPNERTSFILYNLFNSSLYFNFLNVSNFLFKQQLNDTFFTCQETTTKYIFFSTFFFNRRLTFSFSKKFTEMFFNTSHIQFYKLALHFLLLTIQVIPNTFSDVEVWTLRCSIYCSENTGSLFV